MSPPEPSRFPLLSMAELQEQPHPAWLVRDLIGLETLAVLFGKPGVGKSFVALDIALSVASGRSWQGHEVQQGPVLYLVAEGGRGIKKRTQAWEQTHAPRSIEASFLLKAANLHIPKDLEDLTASIGDRRFALIVADTVARTFTGGDENSSQDMGRWVKGVTTLQQQTGASLLAIHHEGKNASQGPRGSTALTAATDTVLRLQTDTHKRLTLSCMKQKDDDPFTTMSLRLEPVVLDGEPGAPSQSSCILVSADSPRAARLRPSHLQYQTLAALAGCDSDAVPSTEWRQATAVDSPRTFQNHKTWLVDHGFVEAVAKQRHHYRLTPQGRVLLKAGPPGDEDHISDAASASPPKRGEQAA